MCTYDLQINLSTQPLLNGIKQIRVFLLTIGVAAFFGSNKTVQRMRGGKEKQD